GQSSGTIQVAVQGEAVCVAAASSCHIGRSSHTRCIIEQAKYLVVETSRVVQSVGREIRDDIVLKSGRRKVDLVAGRQNIAETLGSHKEEQFVLHDGAANGCRILVVYVESGLGVGVIQK